MEHESCKAERGITKIHSAPGFCFHELSSLTVFSYLFAADSTGSITSLHYTSAVPAVDPVSTWITHAVGCFIHANNTEKLLLLSPTGSGATGRGRPTSSRAAAATGGEPPARSCRSAASGGRSLSCVACSAHSSAFFHPSRTLLTIVTVTTPKGVNQGSSPPAADTGFR